MAAPPDVTYIQSLEPTTAKAVAGDIRSLAAANSAYYQHIEIAGGGPEIALVAVLGTGSAALGVIPLTSAGALVSPPYPVIGSAGASQLGPWSVSVAGDVRVLSGSTLPVFLAQTSGRIPVELGATSGSVPIAPVASWTVGVLSAGILPTVGSMQASQAGSWLVSLGASSGDVPITGQVRVVSGGVIPTLLAQTSGRVPVQVDQTSGALRVELASSGDIRVHSGGTLPIAVISHHVPVQVVSGGTLPVAAQQQGSWTVTLGASSGDVPITGQIRVVSGGVIPMLLAQTSGRVPVQLDQTSGALRVELASSGDVRVHSGGTIPTFLAQTSGRIPVQIDQVSGGVMPVGIVSGTLQSTNSVYATQIGSWQVIVTSGGVLPISIVSGTLESTNSVYASQIGSWQTIITSGGVIPVGVVSGTIITTESVNATQVGSWQVRITSGGVIPVGVVSGTILTTESVFVTPATSWTVGVRSGGILPIVGSVQASQAGAWTVAVTSGGILPIVPTESWTVGVRSAGVLPVVGSVTATPATSWTVGVTSGGTLPVTIIGGATGDGAIQDGADNTIEARVFSLAGGNPQAVVFVTPAGSLTAPTSLGVIAAQQGSWTVSIGGTSGDVSVTGQVRVASGGTLPVLLAQTSGRVPIQLDATSGRVPVELGATSGRIAVEQTTSWTVTANGPAAHSEAWPNYPLILAGYGFAGNSRAAVGSGRVVGLLADLEGRLRIKVDSTDGPLGVTAQQQGSWTVTVGASSGDVPVTGQVRVTSGGVLPITGSVQATQAGAWTVAVTSGSTLPVVGSVQASPAASWTIGVTSGGMLPVLLAQTSGRVPVELGATSGSVPIAPVASWTIGQAGSWTVIARGPAQHSEGFPTFPLALAGYGFAGNSRDVVGSGSLVTLLADLEGRLRVRVDSPTALIITSGRIPVQLDSTSGDVPVTGQVRVTSGGIVPILVAQTSGRVPVELLSTSGSVPVALIGSYDIRVHSGSTLPIVPVASWTIAATSGGTLPVFLAQTSGRVPVQIDASSGAFAVIGSVQATQQGSWQVRITSAGTIPVEIVAGAAGVTSVFATAGGLRRLTLQTFADTIARAGSMTLVNSGLEVFRRTQLILCASPATTSLQVRYSHAVTSGTWLWNDVVPVGSATLTDFNVVAPYARLVIELPSSDTYVQGALYAIPLA